MFIDKNPDEFKPVEEHVKFRREASFEEWLENRMGFTLHCTNKQELESGMLVTNNLEGGRLELWCFSKEAIPKIKKWKKETLEKHVKKNLKFYKWRFETKLAKSHEKKILINRELKEVEKQLLNKDYKHFNVRYNGGVGGTFMGAIPEVVLANGYQNQIAFYYNEIFIEAREAEWLHIKPEHSNLKVFIPQTATVYLKRYKNWLKDLLNDKSWLNPKDSNQKQSVTQTQRACAHFYLQTAGLEPIFENFEGSKLDAMKALCEKKNFGSHNSFRNAFYKIQGKHFRITFLKTSENKKVVRLLLSDFPDALSIMEDEIKGSVTD